MHTIFRIEAVDRCGMWYGEFPHKSVSHIPMPIDLARPVLYKSAVASLNDLFSWFSEEQIREMLFDGYSLYMLKVESYIVYEKEILYLEKSIVNREKLELDHVIIEYQRGYF